MPTGLPHPTAIELAKSVDCAALVLNLPLQPAHRPGVIENFDGITTIATLVLEFPLPETVEPAPVFQP